MKIYIWEIKGSQTWAQTASQRTVRLAEELLGDGGHPWQAGAALLPSISAASQSYAILHACGQPLWPGAPRHHPHSSLFLFIPGEPRLPLRSLSKGPGTERLPCSKIAAMTGLLAILGFD